jgi:calreticulin
VDDGEWKAPLIENPEYKGEWKAKTIPNPAFKGRWEHPVIANPDYSDDASLYQMDHIGGVGIEIWQVKAGSIFDNIYVGDDVEEAKEFSEKTFTARKEGEKSAKEAYEEEQERKKEDLKERSREESDEDFEGQKEDL